MRSIEHSAKLITDSLPVLPRLHHFLRLLMLRVSPALRTPSLASELAVPAAGGLTAQTSSACFNRAPLLPSIRRVPETLPQCYAQGRFRRVREDSNRHFILRNALNRFTTHGGGWRQFRFALPVYSPAGVKGGSGIKFFLTSMDLIPYCSRG